MSNRFAQPLDPGILDRARAGDRAAFASIYRQFSAPVYTLALRLTRSPEVAEEVTQEAFLDAMRKLNSFRGEAPFGMWLRQIAVNRALMMMRSWWEQNRSELPEESDIASENDEWPLLWNAMDMQKFLDQLSPVSRAVVWLHDVEGYTHDEIAELMRQSNSFSKSQLARAYAKLRELYRTSEVKKCTPISSS